MKLQMKLQSCCSSLVVMMFDRSLVGESVLLNLPRQIAGPTQIPPPSLQPICGSSTGSGEPTGPGWQKVGEVVWASC